MSRVKRGIMHTKRRKKVLKSAAGFKFGRKKLIKLAKTAVTKAGAHAYVDRRRKKREFRSLWLIKINAAARQNGLTYARLINKMKVSHLLLDRKILAHLGEHHPAVFKQLISEI